jgi:signal transduction histidine kinase
LDTPLISSANTAPGLLKDRAEQLKTDDLQERVRQLEAEKRVLHAEINSLQARLEEAFDVPSGNATPENTIVGTYDANRRLALLNSLSDRIRSSLNPQTVLQTLVDSLGQALNVDRCILVEFETTSQGNSHPLLSYQYSNETLNDLPLLFDQPQIRAFFTTAEPVIINNLNEVISPKTLQRYTKKYVPPRALMGMPLFANSRQIAFLGVVYLDAPHEWTSFEVDLLLDVAERAEGAITNAHLFTQAETERAQINGVLNSMKEGVVVVNGAGNITRLNSVAEKMLGIYGEHAVGMSANQILPFPIQYQATPYQVEYNAQTLSITTGALGGSWERGSVSLLRDVTEENRVNRAKDNFVMLVSHELRTPLTSIKGALEILSDDSIGDLNQIQNDFLRVAVTNADRLHRLLNSVLDVSEIETGRMMLDFAKVNLNEVVTRIYSGALEDAFKSKNISLEVQLSSNALVIADYRRLAQVFEHLLSNACKFTPPQGKVVLSAQPEADNWLRISVRDTGIGINSLDRAHIGEKFFRVDHSLTREVGGSGLGLAITKAIVELHGSQLEVTSIPGKGSSFSFRLEIA